MLIDSFLAIKRHYQDGGVRRVCRVLADHMVSESPFVTAKIRYYTRVIRGEQRFHPFAIFIVDPALIERYVDWNVFGHFPNASRVRGGDWDQAAKPLDTLGKYVLIREFFRGEHTASELTDDRLRAYGYGDSEVSLYDNRDYAAYLEALRNSLAAGGYRIFPPEACGSPYARFDQIAVDIGRDGELLFDENGCHRLALAHVLDQDRIPVRVNAIHQEWYRSNGGPDAHPALTYLTYVPIPWRRLYVLEQSSTTLLPYRRSTGD